MNKHSQTSHKNGWRTIYAYKADYRPTAFDQPDTFGKAGFPTGVPIRLILEAAVRTTFGVCDDAGKPVAGARVAIHFVGESRTYFPDDLIERIAVHTGPDGRAFLTAVPLEQIRQLRVSSESLGIQTFHTHTGFKPGEVLQVRTAQPLAGRVIADQPAAVVGLTVHLNTYHEDHRNLTKHLASGLATVVTDANGRFRVPALATGTLFAAVEAPDLSRYRALFDQGSAVHGFVAK